MPELAQPSGTPPVLDRDALCAAGRTPPVPFRVALRSGSVLQADEVLRILPGKRIVVRAVYEGRVALAKLYIGEGSERHWQREFDGIKALVVAGLPTPGLILAERLATGGEAILTEYLEGSRTLFDDLQAPTGQDSLALNDTNMLQPAFELLGRMHAHGITHEDLHFGNFLRHLGKTYIIDGDSVRQYDTTPLRRHTARDNLALLIAQLPLCRDENLPLLVSAYCRGNPQYPFTQDELASPVTLARSKRTRNFLGKVQRNCSRFRIEKHFDRYIALARDAESELGELICNPDYGIESGTRLKDGGTCTVACVSGTHRTFVIKRYNLKNWKHALSRIWRPSRAWHSWIEGHRLWLLGVSTPRPCAVIEERLGILRRRAWLITEYCEGTSLIKHLDPDCDPPSAEANAIRKLFQTLFRARVSHGDLKASNLIWSDDKLFLIDLDAMQHHRTGISHSRAWRRDRRRLLQNWPSGSALHAWLDKNLPD